VVGGNVEFVPTANVCGLGAGSFRYRIDDDHGGVASAVVRVDVACIDDPPVANDDTATTATGVPVDIDVLANDTDIDTPRADLHTSSTSPNVASAGSALRYTPPIGFCGTDTFTYSLTDGSQVSSAHVRVTVSCPPLAANAGGPYSTEEGVGVVITAGATGGSDGPRAFAWDLDNDGTFETPGTAVTVTPADGPATRAITVRVTDAYGHTADATSSITVTNVAPTATFSAPSTAASGAAYTLAMTSPTDAASDLATLQYAFDCGGGTLGALTSSASITCTGVAGPATRVVRGRVVDKDGGVTLYTGLVTVAAPVIPPAPALDLTPQCSVATRLTLRWQVVNPGSAAVTFTYDVNGIRLPLLLAGRITVPAHAAASFTTIRLPGQNTARIYVNGVLVDTASGCP